MHVIQRYIVESKTVLFEGDGYSEEWHHEAERRGLANVRTTPLALDAIVTEKAKRLFESNKVYTHSELEARHEIELEKYIKKVQIEARVMGDLAINHIIPVAVEYQNQLIKNIKGLKEAGLPEESFAAQSKILKEISHHLQIVFTKVNQMIDERKIVNNMSDTRTKAIAYNSQIKEAFFDEIRYHADKLEIFY